MHHVHILCQYNAMKIFQETKYQGGNTISLQLQVSVTVFVHILFCVLDVKCNWWVMHACV
jgi:hypothetical protein